MVHEHLGTDKIHGSVRFGIGPMNTAQQIDTAIAAVGEIASLGRRRRG
jgi:cysteine sulfinate desulfinase/cysteine desulfurase-like protein